MLPVDNPVAEVPDWASDHTNEYGDTPPLPSAKMNPSAPPLHVTSVIVVVPTTAQPGSITLQLSAIEHKLPSETVTFCIPAVSPVMDEVVSPPVHE